MATALSFKTPEKYSVTKKLRCECVQFLLNLHGGRLDWRGGERVIDFGCGVGDVSSQCFLPLLPKNFKKLTLTDLSPKMLEYTKEEFKEINNVDIMQMDIGGEIDANLLGSFDKVFSTFCINFVADQQRVFENVHNLLAPGGECLLILSITSSFFEPAFHLMDTPKWKEHLKKYRDVFVFPYREDVQPERTVRNLLESIGFRDVFVKKNDFNGNLDLDFFRATLNCLPDFPNTMSKEEKEDFIEDEIKLGISFNAIADCRNESIPVAYPSMENLIIHAKKAKN